MVLVLGEWVRCHRHSRRRRLRLQLRLRGGRLWVGAEHRPSNAVRWAERAPKGTSQSSTGPRTCFRPRPTSDYQGCKEGCCYCLQCGTSMLRALAFLQALLADVLVASSLLAYLLVHYLLLCSQACWPTAVQCSTVEEPAEP